MPTLYVENVPPELYEALRARAKRNRTSIAAEVMSLLEENISTAAELQRREQLLREVQHFQSRRPAARGPFPSAEQMQREGRER